jgi:hypothetical protein
MYFYIHVASRGELFVKYCAKIRLYWDGPLDLAVKRDTHGDKSSIKMAVHEFWKGFLD